MKALTTRGAVATTLRHTSAALALPPVQVKPLSTAQVPLHPSPAEVPPSSQASLPVRRPSPHFWHTLAALVLILWRRLSIVPPLMTALSRQPILGKWMSYGRSFNVQDMNRLEAVMTMYLIYWGIHIYIGTQRVMYIYHYFLALILVFFMSALVFKILFDRFENLKAFRFNTALVMALLIGAGFIFYSPLTFHKPLTREQCELRNIPFTAVICQPKAKSNH
jgi:hypothetical protein